MKSPAPADPIAAVIHPHPSGYYARLAEGPPHVDPRLGCWVVAAPRHVRALLGDPAALVRPPGERVPAYLVGTPAGDLFGRLVRMSDGEAPRRLAAHLRAALAGIAPARIQTAVGDVAREVGAGRSAGDPAAWTELIPTGVIGRLLELEIDAPQLTDAARALARAFGPHGTAELTGAASAATERVLAAIAARPTAMLVDLRQAAVAAGLDEDDADANLTGLLFQTFDAMAGLVGSALIHASLAPDVPAADVVQAVVRDDPPIHNTRRFTAAPVELGGVTIPAGATVLVLLAAAGLADPSLPLAFGAAHHACPASGLAPNIAADIVARWRCDPRRPREARVTGFRDLPNARVPVLVAAGDVTV